MERQILMSAPSGLRLSKTQKYDKKDTITAYTQETKTYCTVLENIIQCIEQYSLTRNFELILSKILQYEHQPCMYIY